MKDYLDEALIEYGASDIYPFHMPGHKRRRLGDFTPEEIDVTEIGEFDDLHCAEGILREGQERTARVFGADESFWLVNGSTAGILAAVCGCVRKGGRILIARNCHRSVYNAAYLMEAKLAYLVPEPTGFGICGSIDPAQVEEALQRFPDTQAVVLTSPTYDGVVSDILRIAQIVHDRNIPLIIDEAHGAHFGFAESFPQKALALGADLCVESLHKTLPAYTQSAVLHLKRTAGGYRFDAARVRRYLDLFQSSSPSYVLMAGIDRCVRMIAEDEELYRHFETRPDSLFGQFEERLRDFYAQCGALRTVRLFPGSGPSAFDSSDGGISAGSDRGTGGRDPLVFARDPSRILICAEEAGLNGQQLFDLLLMRYHLQMEMAAGSYVIALTTLMDTDEGFARLIRALEEIDRKAPFAAASRSGGAEDLSALYAPREKRMEIAQAMDAETKALPVSDSAGRISAEFVCLYPPGIPILVPGEVLSNEVIDCLRICRGRGMQIRGMRDPGGTEILVVA